MPKLHKKMHPRFRARRMVWSGGETFHVEVVVGKTESWLKTSSVPRELRKFIVPSKKYDVVTCGNLESARELACRLQEIYDRKIAEANAESVGKLAESYEKSKGA